MKTKIPLAALTTALTLCAWPASAQIRVLDDPVYESAVLGSTGAVHTWYDIEDRQFLGCRFHLPTETVVSGVGGHLFRRFSHDGSIFAAITRLDSLSGLPSAGGQPFILDDVMATGLFSISSSNSADYVFPLSVTLAPGDYALVFGSGLFGDPHAANFGFAAGMPYNNADLPGASYIVWQSLPQPRWREESGVRGVRFAVYGIRRHPPVPVVQVRPALNSCPGYYCDPHGTTYWVIAPNGSSATVVFDASASYDLDKDALSFRWARLEDGEQFFSDSVQTTNVWHGSTQFRLYVFDGTATTPASFAVYLLTPADVARNLIDAMDELELDEGIHIRGRNSLDTLLGKAAQHFGQGELARAVHFLELFQKRIAAQSDLLGAANAQDLIGITQAVIDAVSSSR